MNQYLRQLPVALFGLVSVHWWPWAVYELQQLINLLAGSPGRPAQEYAWLAVLGAPFVVGLASGAIIYLLNPSRPVRSLIVFWVFLLVGFVIFAFSIGTVLALYLPFLPGTWAFALGSVIAPLSLRSNESKN